MQRTLVVIISLLLIGCTTNQTSQAPLPSAKIALLPSPTLPIRRVIQQQATIRRPPSLPTTTRLVVASLVPSEPTAINEPLDRLEQFRRWIDEARTLYPYNESVDKMWDVMMCESSGDPDVVGAGIYHGLFQYSDQTWSGEWNPYRDRSIFDPQAQIFATAKAWQEGNQGWWGCY